MGVRDAFTSPLQTPGVSLRAMCSYGLGYSSAHLTRTISNRLEDVSAFIGRERRAGLGDGLEQGIWECRSIQIFRMVLWSVPRRPGGGVHMPH